MPGYEQTFFPDEEKRKKLRLIASRDGRNGSVSISQDINLYAALLESGEEIAHVIPEGRHAWLQVAHGSVAINGHHLEQGDGAAASEENKLIVTGKEKAEVLLFDLA